MTFWHRFWHGSQESHGDARLRAILARVEELEPISKRYIVGITGLLKTVGYREWRAADPDERGIFLVFVQNTPDGELTTTVHSSYGASDAGMHGGTARVTVELPSAVLGTLHFLEGRDASPPGCQDQTAKVNKFAVQYVREWCEQRAQTAFEATAEQRDERRNADDLQERERNRAALRKKYLP
jgi:hypothetical protein